MIVFVLIMTFFGQYKQYNQTCYIVKFPEIHFNVIPLHDHTAVGVGCSHRHEDILFKGEDVRGHGLNGNGLMTHKVYEMKTQK